MTISAFCLGIALISSLEGPAAPFLIPTQSETRIRSDAQVERLERAGIETPMHDVSGAPAMKGMEESQDQQMQRESRAPTKVMKGSAVIGSPRGGSILLWNWCYRLSPSALRVALLRGAWMSGR